jgi:hypothetical protein
MPAGAQDAIDRFHEHGGHVTSGATQSSTTQSGTETSTAHSGH